MKLKDVFSFPKLKGQKLLLALHKRLDAAKYNTELAYKQGQRLIPKINDIHFLSAFGHDDSRLSKYNDNMHLMVQTVTGPVIVIHLTGNPETDALRHQYYKVLQKRERFKSTAIQLQIKIEELEFLKTRNHKENETRRFI